MQGYASPHLEEDNWTVFATTLTRKEIVLYRLCNHKVREALLFILFFSLWIICFKENDYYLKIVGELCKTRKWLDLYASKICFQRYTDKVLQNILSLRKSQ